MFPQIANSPIHLQPRKPYIMHLLDSLTEQEKLMSFLCDHISPRPLHHMVAKQPESCSQLASVQARSSICKSTCSTSSLGCWPGTQAGTQVPEGATPALSSASRHLPTASVPLWAHCPPLHWSPGPQAAAPNSQLSCLLAVVLMFSPHSPSVARFPTCLPFWTLLQAEPISCLEVKNA